MGSPGPERPTIIERFVGLIPLPYLVSSAFLVLTANFLGGMYLSYLDSYDLGKALTAWLMGTQDLGFVLFLVISVYVLYAPRYMRLRLITTGRSIVPLLPKGEEDFHKLFRVSAVRPQLIIFALLYAWTLFSFSLPRGSSEFTPISGANGIVNGAVFLLVILGVSSTVWSYLSSLRAIHRMGAAPLQLPPYYRDRFLGLRAVGSLALSLAVVFFVFVGMISILPLVTPQPLASYFFLAGLIVLGLLMFFLPLNKIHELMVQQKARERAKVEQNLDDVYRNVSQMGSMGDRGQLFFSLSISDMVRKEVSSVATWPFDTGILARLSAIIVSVVAILLSKVIQEALRIR